MYRKLTEVSVETFFRDYLPGEDPSQDVLDKFHYECDLHKVKTGSELRSKICEMADSVLLHAKKGPSIVTRDIADRQTFNEDDVKKPKVDPGVGMYFKMDDEQMIQIGRSLSASAWRDLGVRIDARVRRSVCAFDFSDCDGKFTLEDDEYGEEALEKLSDDIAEVFAHQHRTHLFSVYVFRNKARLLYFDRAGGIVSEWFVYGTRDTGTLHKFLWRIAHMGREDLGFDPTAALASDDEVMEMVEYVRRAPTPWMKEQAYHALSWDPDVKVGRESMSAQWPVYRVAVGGLKLLIGRPKYATSSLFGRCTRGYVAYDLEAKEVRFLKDCWRVEREKMRPEHEVYAKLAKEDVKYIPTCVCGEDVGDGRGGVQETRTQKLLGEKVSGQVHYRLVMKEVCRPLKDFQNFRQLCQLIGNAMYGHREAWTKAGVLHHDVSVNNILIFETCGEGGNVYRKGLLSDWELCKYKEDMGTGKEAVRPDRTGTWYFKSAAMVLWPRKPYALSDDIESFVHVFHYCVLRFHPTNYTDSLSSFVRGTYGFMRVRASDGAHIGSERKFDIMSSAAPMIKPKKNSTLLELLSLIARLCAEHYAMIDEEEYDDLYLASQCETVVKQTNVQYFTDTEEGTNELAPSSTPANQPIPASTQATARKLEDTPTLNKHDDLLFLFLYYGAGVRNSDRIVRKDWPLAHLIKTQDDLFKEVGLDACKDNYFSSSSSEGSDRNSSNENDSSTLESIVESTDEE